MSDAVKNPFRIPKPKDDIIFKGNFVAATVEDNQAGDVFDRLNVILTTRHLWLTAELSIPLSSIKSVGLIKKDRVIEIVYRHWLEQQDETVLLR